MAAFEIHEDVENIDVRIRKIGGKKHLVRETVANYEKQIAKKFIVSGKYENCGLIQKKSFLNNQEALILTKFIVKSDSETGDTISEESKEQDNRPVIEEPFLEIEKENRTAKIKEEEDTFPLNILHSVEYRAEIWSYLRQLEKNIPLPKPTIMRNQNEINWDSRSILVDWLSSVSGEYKFNEETFHLGVNYIDRFLSQICIAKNKFQLVGAAAMMIASKMEEYYSIDAKEWSFLTGDTFSKRQVLKMEQVILKVLKFRMQTPTINSFIQHLATEHQLDEKTLHLAMYIGELVLLEGDHYFKFVPSKLASASIALARYTLWKRNVWPKKLEKASGYTIKELSPVVNKQHRTLKDSPMKKQQAIQTKYKSEKYNQVALTKTRKILIWDFIKD